MNLENLNNNSLENTLDSATETKSENNLLGAISKCLTFAPLVYEQLTGQKVPQITGTMAEIQGAINQLNTLMQKVIGNQQVIVDNQTKLNTRLANLENNANQKLFNLTNKVDKISTVKLTHEKERKQIEYSPNQRLAKFSQGQQQIITLLKENNQLQKLILAKLGGQTS
ncbi:10091_t:CDS:2 [Funneliformis geosporum]|uniref:19549_t:CDS:1 n=1 Tax=Funneliformis geosporum TaxID=1117311 RepID=A0A9W4TB88_9GLOM|nr:10091_t:CDS:2 [Funneliformis geosporum]CAI2198846.1 19549_t:CDS:2 [Funneliformis geosporum]